jgi:hydroxypyruvate isomerase
VVQAMVEKTQDETMSKPMGPALSVCAEMVFLQLPFIERVQRLSELGFHVEIWDWTRHDIDELATSGATFASMTGFLRGGLDTRDGGEAVIRSAEETVPIAERLGCRRLVIHGTQLHDGVAVNPVSQVTGTTWINAYRTLSKLAELGERAGVTFCLENLNRAVDHPGVPFARASETLELVTAVDSPALRMMLDLYHAQTDEENLIELVQRAGPFIGHVHVADVPGRHEPGTGKINYPRSGTSATQGRSGWRGGRLPTMSSHSSASGAHLRRIAPPRTQNPHGDRPSSHMRDEATFTVKAGLAEMLKGGVIMDVVTPEQARVAEAAGACSVMALERVPADIRRDGGVARMSDPEMVKGIQEAVTIPVMAKARIGHFADALRRSRAGRRRLDRPRHTPMDSLESSKLETEQLLAQRGW